MAALAAIRFLSGMLAPPRCSICGRPCDAAAAACERCTGWLAAAPAGSAVLPRALPASWSAPYEGPARELVAGLKFAGRLRLAGLAAEAIAAQTPGLEGFTVVAVPASPLRRRTRGFDPADAIAAELAPRLGLGIGRPIARAHGPRQVGRSRRERICSGPRVRAVDGVPDRVLLVDDVLTTGATLGACAEALRAAGCGDVRCAVFARAL